MTQPPDFAAALEAAAEAHSNYFNGEDSMSNYQIKKRSYKDGWHACAAHLAEQAGREFAVDVSAAREASTKAHEGDDERVKLSTDNAYRMGHVEGARYQHQRDWDRIATEEGRADMFKEALVREQKAYDGACKRIAELEERVEQLKIAVDKATDIIASERTTVAKLREALEFYADPKNWYDSDCNVGDEFMEIEDSDGTRDSDNHDKLCGGKRARQALEGVKE